MIYYAEPDSYIRGKVKEALDLSNYATKNKLKDATAVETSNLTAKSNFIPLKAEAHKLDIIKLVNVPTSLNNLKTKVDDLDVDKLKTVPRYLKDLSGAVSNKSQNSTQ